MYTVSIHCDENFPFVKSVSHKDVSVPAGATDKDYLPIVKSTFEEAIRQFSPDFVLYDAGVDISEHDKLGKLKVSDQGIYDRDYWVLSECVKRSIPVAAVIGGGYDDDLKSLAFRHSLLHRAVVNISDQVANNWKLRFRK